MVLREASVLKALGYFTSTLSVILLGVVALEGAQKSTLLSVCLLGGMATSILGMFLRWRSHRLEQHEKDRLEAKATRAHPEAGLSTAP